MAKNGKFKPEFGKTLKTFKGRLLFPSLANPTDFEGDGRMKYRCSLILKPSERMTEILEEVERVGTKTFGKDWGTPKCNKPILTGEECMERSDKCREELYAEHYRLTASRGLESFQGKPLEPPTCYLADGSKMPRRPGNADDLKMIEQVFYPGALCVCAVTPFSYQKGKVQGVGLTLKAIRFMADAPRLSGEDVEGLMASDEDSGSWEFEDEADLGSSEVDEANV